MNQFTKRLLIFGCVILGFASIALALSQAVSYKPWGVPDSRRADYDKKIAELDRQAELREAHANQPRPSAFLANRTHDFGWVRPGELLEHAFSITNRGQSELSLNVRGTSSDRLKAVLESQTLQPGQATRCAIEWSGAAEPISAPMTGRVTLLTNDPLQSTLVLTLRGRGRRQLVHPSKLDFGSHDLGESSTVEFLVYSQLGQELEVVELSNGAFDLEWVAIEEDTASEQLDGTAATVAKRIRLEMESPGYGRYSDELNLKVNVDGVEQQSKIAFGGRVRPPIGFYGPAVDMHRGVSFGTVESGKRHDLFVVVRSRSDRSRPIEVLGVEPKELETELQPLETEGSYRLRISIPADCPYRRFNLAEQHGYVHVGDPEMTSYSSSLPVYGCVGDFKPE